MSDHITSSATPTSILSSSLAPSFASAVSFVCSQPLCQNPFVRMYMKPNINKTISAIQTNIDILHTVQTWLEIVRYIKQQQQRQQWVEMRMVLVEVVVVRSPYCYSGRAHLIIKIFSFYLPFVLLVLLCAS